MPRQPKPDGGGGKPAKADVIVGTEGSDGGDLVPIGTSGDDTIDLLGGDDIVIGTLGNDKIDGGDGIDFLIYAADFGTLDFDVSRIEKGKNVTFEITYTVGGTPYTDTIKNIEYIFFPDGTALDLVNNILYVGDYQTPPPAPGTITFEGLSSVDFSSVGGTVYQVYKTGPNDAFIVSQQTSATNGYEDVEPLANFDGSADGDFEFKVWTDGVGTHEMAVFGDPNGALAPAFSIESLLLSGLDAGEEVTFYTVSSSGLASDFTLTAGAAQNGIENGVLDLTQFSQLNWTDPNFLFTDDILQFSVVAGSGDEFYVDNLVIA